MLFRSVFVPDFTFFSSGEIVSHCGAVPIFVDVCEETFNIDPDKLESAIINARQEGKYELKAVVAVDLFGLPADMPKIRTICDNMYGGTIDWYGEIDGKRWLVDIKTSKGLYPEHTFQVSAYWQMLIENGYPVDGVRLLCVGRTEDEGFDDHVIDIPALSDAWKVFEAALNLYRLKGAFERRAA